MLDGVIVGGGIGGLSAAIALQQTGADAQIYEATPELRQVGAGILIPPNAMKVLAWLGLAQLVVDAGLTVERAELRQLNGRLLRSFDDVQIKSRLEYPTVAVRRSELQHILISALKPDSLHLGKRLVRFEDLDASVRAEFEEGSSVEGRVLIGADGIHSSIRRQLFPNVSLRYSGQTCFRGLASIALPDDLRQTAREIWGGKFRFGFSGVGGDNVYWFAPMKANRGNQLRDDNLKAKLLEAYRIFPRPGFDILASTAPEAIVQTDLFDFLPIKKWHAGRAVLLGDAAHATTPNLGQGGAQAIEDALCLALKLRAMGFSPQAFEAYEKLRAPRTKKIVNMSWEWGRMAHWQNPFLQSMRDFAIRAVGRRLQKRQLDDLFTPRV